MFRRRFLGLFLLGLVFAGCGGRSTTTQVIVGVVSYGEGSRSLERYQSLREHLSKSLQGIVQLEPALNEVQAVQQISQKSWDVMIAPPGLSALAISVEQYIPILPRTGGNKERSIIIVRNDSEATDIKDIGNQTLALGQEGSATGYYFPIYNLYGLTLSEVKFAPTPKKLMEWVEAGEVAAGALSIAEYERYLPDFQGSPFRILFRDSHPVPPGSVLISPNVSEELKSRLVDAFESTPPNIVNSTGFVPNAAPPNYDYLIQVVKRVRPIAQRIKEKPAPLY